MSRRVSCRTMLRTVPASTTVSLLDFLVPSLLCRPRTFSNVAVASNSSNASRTRTDALVQQRKLRDQIMEQVHAKPIVSVSLKNSHNNYIHEISKAVGARNLTQALRLWGNMKTDREAASHDDLFHLPLHNQKHLANIFVSQFFASQKSWTDDMKTIARDFAVEAAANDISDPLHILMLDHIERNEPDVAIELYALYQRKVDKPVDSDSQSTDLETGLVVEDVEQSYNPGRVYLLLTITTAYAMQNSFHDALRTFLEADLKVPAYQKERLFQSLEGKPDLNQKVQKYLHRLSVAAMVSQPIYFSKRIMHVSQPRSIERLQQLYNDVMDGISGPEPYLAADASGVSPERPVAMTESGWTTFQTAFLKSERPDLASNIWMDLEKNGFTPGVTMWTALIDAYADLRNSRQAMLTWNMMLENGVKPDALCYRAIITALFDDNNAEAALSRFKEYRRTIRVKTGYDILVYNTVLRGLLRLSRIDEANLVLQAMQNKGPVPDIVSYNTFLAYYTRQKDFKGLSSIVSQMSEADIPGDVISFSTILTALLNAGRKDAPTTILSLMRKQGIQPNVATYSAIIDHQIRQQTEESLAAALNILDKMEQDESTRPNEVTYTSILAGLYRGSWISPAHADAVKKEIMAKMKRACVSLKMPTYHILIRAAVDSQNPKGYLDALALLEDMEKEGLPRTNTVWYILFMGLMQQDLWDVAKVMVKKMESSGHEPSPRVERLVNEIKRR